MSVKTSDDSLEPVTSLAITGTLRLRTRTVITVANMPSVRASSLPLPRDLECSTGPNSFRLHKSVVFLLERLSDFYETSLGSRRREWWWAGRNSDRKR